MKLPAKRVRRFVTSEDGPTGVEHAVMLALVIIVILTAINSIAVSSVNIWFALVSSYRLVKREMRRRSTAGVGW